MNDKIQAILLKIIVELKKLRWKPAPDWEITVQSEGHVPLIKLIKVTGGIGDKEWNDEVEAYIDLKLFSEDNITYFPNFTIYGNISIQGGNNHDIVYKMDADVAFTEKDIRNDSKIASAAKKINRLVEIHMDQEYNDYISDNAQEIMSYRKGGWKEDEPYRGS